MNVYPEDFPEDRTHDPMWQAELTVFRQLQASDKPGVALYEARAGAQGREMDFAIRLEDIARIDLQVKGGRYRVDRGSWHLITQEGEGRKPSPAKQSWESSLQLHHYLQEPLPAGRNPFIVPILAFLDLERDTDMEVWSGLSRPVSGFCSGWKTWWTVSSSWFPRAGFITRLLPRRWTCWCPARCQRLRAPRMPRMQWNCLRSGS